MKTLALKYTLMLLTIVALTAGVVGGGIYWSLFAALTSRLPDVGERSLTASLLLGDINQILFVVGPVLLAGVALISVVILRKFAEPEYRIAQALQALAEGNFASARDVREGGELAELTRLLQQAADKLMGMVREERRITNELLTTASALIEAVDSGKPRDPKHTRELAQTLLDQLDQLQILNTRYQLK